MISVKDFYNKLAQNSINFFTGVPDSLLKNICAYISDHTNPERNIIAANEGGAIAIATGYHLATNKIPLVYMQNSGIGNSINPLLSLADKEIYSIPLLLMIGWRGEPGVIDEPQHLKQGRVSIPILESMEIPFFILDANCNSSEILNKAITKIKEISAPVALLVKKNTFEPYELKKNNSDFGNMSREEALELVIKQLPKNSIVVSTTGMLSRELFELREKYQQSHQSDFLTVGSMGHASQIALGIALAKPNKKIFCFDGDGAAIMHLGHMAIIGATHLRNFNHIIFNNSAHDSVGGQPTVGNIIDFQKLAEGTKYSEFKRINSKKELEKLNRNLKQDGPTLIEIIIKRGARKDLGRPTTSTIQNKNLFKTYVQK